MKKLLTIYLILLATFAQSQETKHSNALSKLESARIALITERLGLSPDQAQQFWPIYNEYAEQRRGIQLEYRSTRQGMDMNNLTEEQSRVLVKARIAGQQRQLNLESTYSDRLMEIISNRQLVALRRAEDDFRQMIIRRLEQRRRQQSQRDRMLLDRERKRQQGNN